MARGAVALELVVLLLPLFFVFLGTIQLIRLETARLMTKHATIIGTRAAAVFANAGNVTPDQPSGLNQDKVEAAMRAAIGNLHGALTFDIEVKDDSNCNDPYGPVTVKTRATYRCVIPMGKLLCRAPGFRQGSAPFSVVLEDEYTLPHQGAKYKGKQSGGGCN